MCKHFCFSFISCTFRTAGFARISSRFDDPLDATRAIPDRSGMDQHLGEINWRESNGPCNRYVSLSAYTLIPDPCYLVIDLRDWFKTIHKYVLSCSKKVLFAFLL